MASKTWGPGTLIDSAWLQDVNDFVYGPDGTLNGFVSSVERQTATPGQTIITLTEITYSPNVNSVRLLVDGLEWQSGVDYTESYNNIITLTAPLFGGEQLDIHVGKFVSSGFSSDTVSVPAPNAAGQAVSLTAELLRGKISVHRFAGVVGDGLNDDTAGLQEAITFAQENNLLLEFDGSKTYYTTGTLVWQHGRNAVDTFVYNVAVKGNGATMLPNHNGKVFYIEPRCPDSLAGTGREIAKITFGGFFVNGYYINLNSYTSAQALVIGKTAYIVDSFAKSSVYDITVQLFLTPPFVVEQARMIKFERLITRDDSGGMLIKILRDGFVGDITVEDSEFEGNTTNRPLHVYASASTVFAEARGIRLVNCVMYGSGFLLESGLNGKVDDIWLDNVACDGPDAPSGQPAIELYAHDGGDMSQVFIMKPYIVNYTGSALIVRRTGSSSFRAVELAGGYVRQITATHVINIAGAENIAIIGVNFVDNSGTNEIFVADTSSHIRVSNNDSVSGATNLVSFTGATTDNFVAWNNTFTNATGVVNTAGGVTYSINNNFRMTA